MEARLAAETWPGVAKVAADFAGDLPIAWIEAAYQGKCRGAEAKGENFAKGRLRWALNLCVSTGACEWYTPPAASSPPGSPTPAPIRGGELPSVVHQREMRLAMRTPRFDELMAKRGGTDV